MPWLLKPSGPMPHTQGFPNNPYSVSTIAVIIRKYRCPSSSDPEDLHDQTAISIDSCLQYAIEHFNVKLQGLNLIM